MNPERSQLYYTCVFLQVSFAAIKRSVEDRGATPESRCWLDAQTLGLLLAELERSRRGAVPYRELHEALDAAVHHCGLLMAQCPGALNRRLCCHISTRFSYRLTSQPDA